MRAVVIDTFGQTPELRDVSEPQVMPDGVILAVQATGLCRSDAHAWSGHDPGVRLPHVPGHEFVGTVVARGSQVRRVQVGQRIITPFVCGCGTCTACRGGNAQVCPHQTQPGFTHWGSFADRVQVRHADFNAIVVDDDTDPAHLVSLGCRFATAFRALHDRAHVRGGESVAVFGAGGVGLAAVMIATAAGASVLAVDPNPGARDLAHRAGAVAVLEPTGLHPTQVAEAVVQDFGRPQVTVEALGAEATAQAALLALASGGRHVQVGLFATEPSLPVGRIIGEELSVLGSHGMAAASYGPMLDSIASGALRPADLVTRQLSLDEAPAALATMGDAPVAGMTVIIP